MMTERLRGLCGISLIVLGVVAVLVPVIPGIPLIAAGVAMLGSDHPTVRTCRTWLRNRGIWTQQRNQDEPSNVQG